MLRMHPRRSEPSAPSGHALPCRVLWPVASVFVAFLPLLLAACERSLSDEPIAQQSQWRAFGSEGESFTLLSDPKWDVQQGALTAQLALRADGQRWPQLRRQIRLTSLGVGSPAGVRVDWTDEKGVALWSYELELGATTPLGFALTERSAEQTLRIELSESEGWITEKYVADGRTVTSLQSVAHVESCTEETSDCFFADEHRSLAAVGESFAQLYTGLGSLHANREGERLTQLLASPELRQELRSNSPLPLLRNPTMATVCRWAERALVKCRFFPAQNPICHAAIGTTIACWIAELVGE